MRELQTSERTSISQRHLLANTRRLGAHPAQAAVGPGHASKAASESVFAPAREEILSHSISTPDERPEPD